MNGFQKRVALLEKWAPNLLPNLKDLDDMADIILDVWDEAEKHTEERIIKVIEGYLHHDYLTGQNEDEMLDELYLSELITLIKGENK